MIQNCTYQIAKLLTECTVVPFAWYGSARVVPVGFVHEIAKTSSHQIELQLIIYEKFTLPGRGT